MGSILLPPLCFPARLPKIKKMQKLNLLFLTLLTTQFELSARQRQ
jgi:hypothetical protein